MREAIGNSFLFYFVITFFALFIFFFVGSLAYTKAFKVKNKIVDEIEIFEGDIVGGNNTIINEFQSSVDEKLGEIGYRISSDTTCDTNGRFSGSTPLNKTGTSNYRYCIYKYDANVANAEQRGVYYGVVAYMYYEIPIVGIKLEFPVYGETKVFTDLSR